MDYFALILAVVVSVWLLILYYFKNKYKYWERRNVLYIEPSFPFGSLGNPLVDQKGIAIRLKEAYDDFKAKGVKFGGLYFGMSPALLAVSPEIVKTALHTAFDHFEGHGNVVNEKKEPLSAHLANLAGTRWKNLRTRLTPTFTSSKMKMMFQTLLDCGDPLKDVLNELCQQNEYVDVKETLARFTTDVIGSCAFGLECNSLKNPDAEFRRYCKKFLELSVGTMVRRFFSVMCPGIVRALNVPMLNPEASDFFLGAIKSIVNHRRTNNITRNDFVQILMNMEEAGFTVEEIAAQAFVFFLAGFETSSTTMTFCLYELAHHQEIQERVRNEINSVIQKHNGKLTYEGVMEMKYLDQVVNETLRKYPPLPVLKRRCNKDYRLENGPIIKKGNSVFFCVLGLHRDKEYYPDPDKFDPERFSDEKRGNIPPYAFIPFGEGPRICIGLRFAFLQTKVGLCLLLGNYKISPHESMKYPIEYETNTFILQTKGPVLLNFKKC